MADKNIFLERQAILVNQPFGEFYIVSIPASKLVKIVYSLPAKYGEISLDGVQRGLNKKRVDNISRFCKTENALFPNSIILAANILEDGSYVDSDKEWVISSNNQLIVPFPEKIASIVDGQHRIEGLKKSLEDGGEDFDVVCSIYMDLPAPRQAEVFATINFNQQKVDKSLAYQLFGYDLDASEPKYWAPDTLAISLVRILNSSDVSPFKNHIAYGMKDKYLKFKDSDEEKLYLNDPWKISTSTMVEGVVRLISSNPTFDRYELHKKRTIRKDRSILKEVQRRSSEPWRPLYLSYKDAQLYDLIQNYFIAVNNVLWIDRGLPLLRKTIGIQALFDLLKVIAEDNPNINECSIDRFSEMLNKINLEEIQNLDINYSGVGRTQIRTILVNAYKE